MTRHVANPRPRGGREQVNPRWTLGPVVLGLLAATLVGLVGCLHTQQARLQSEDETDRERFSGIKTVGDLTTVGNVVAIPVGGVGLVEGLEGTGGDSSPHTYRTMLLDRLRKEGVENPRHLLASPNTALVIISGVIPAGARKGDKIDLQVKLPQGSRATSLRGGYLRPCKLYNYSTTRNLSSSYAGPSSLLLGHPLVHGQGPILVGLGAGDEAARLKVGRIWAGGRCQTDHPFSLLLNPDQQYARVASHLANRINETFQGSFRAAPEDSLALASNNLAIGLRVPAAYRYNLPRYLRVVRFIPLARQAHRARARDDEGLLYIQKLRQDLLDPGRCVVAALRLEALGETSKPTLKEGLHSEHAIVRFVSAEALAYLGSPSCADELARAVAAYPEFRTFGLTALASLDEAICQNKLLELLSTVTQDDARYGAFRALRALNERHPVVRGEYLNDSFWLHEVAPNTPPLVHISTSRRAEIVLFGPTPHLVPPFSCMAGEFAVTATEDDNQCFVSRFYRNGGPVRKTCSLRLDEILRTMADLGGTYPEVVALLEQAHNCRCLTARVAVNALPQATTVYDLVRAGQKANHNEQLARGETQQGSNDLGITPTLYQLEATPGLSLLGKGNN
jgi:hypothetical protein